MWIFLNDSALSVVADRTDPAHLLVRARVCGDIERVFPDAHVRETEDADYRYRASIPRDNVASALAQLLCSIGYDNFKNSCDTPRDNAYMEIWESWMREAAKLNRQDRVTGPEQRTGLSKL